MADCEENVKATNPPGGRSSNNPRVLLLIPSYTKRGVEERVAANSHPTMDYFALKSRLGADLADYSTVDADPRPLVQASRRCGLHVALAVHAFLQRGHYDVIFSNAEHVGLPLAGLLKTVKRRPGHVVIGHRVSSAKKKPFFRVLHHQMDAIFLYAQTQLSYAKDVLRIPARKLRLIAFHADTRFYHPTPEAIVERRISSAGLEWRDYPTLIEAVRGLDVDVRLAAASPWSKDNDETEDIRLPPNVTAQSYSYDELRDLYASSLFVVVPLYENDFQAGVTTLLEAMAMGKAVIVTRTTGQRDVIADGSNGLYVPPGNALALRDAIVHLLSHPDEAVRLGVNARRTVESRMSLDSWADRIAEVVREVAGR
jgi:glycosyltransferase involved in cell wall biosynthesis